MTRPMRGRQRHDEKMGSGYYRFKLWVSEFVLMQYELNAIEGPIPAKAGTHAATAREVAKWAPAFAGVVTLSLLGGGSERAGAGGQELVEQLTGPLGMGRVVLAVMDPDAVDEDAVDADGIA